MPQRNEELHKCSDVHFRKRNLVNGEWSALLRWISILQSFPAFRDAIAFLNIDAFGPDFR